MSAFYRVDQDGIYHRAAKFVFAPTYELHIEDKDSYTYPTEGGWLWFATREEACAHFGLPEDFLFFGEEPAIDSPGGL